MSGDHIVQAPAQSRANFKFVFGPLSSQVLKISRGRKTRSLSRQLTFSKATTYLQSCLLQYVHISIWHTTAWESLCWLSIILVILIKIAPQSLTYTAVWVTGNQEEKLDPESIVSAFRHQAITCYWLDPSFWKYSMENSQHSRLLWYLIISAFLNQCSNFLLSNKF